MKTMLTKSSFILALVIILMSFDYPGEANEDATMIPSPATECSQCQIVNNTFQAGEEFVFEIYYNWNFVWLSAGEVVFKVEDEGDQYHLSAHGTTYRNYEWFFKVRDKYDSYVDKESLLPSVSIRDILEGKYTLYDEITFDNEKKVAKSFRGKTKETAELTEYPIESCMHDILSIVYFSRNLDFDNMETGEHFPIKIFVDKETWPLQVTYKGKEKKKRIKGMGKFKVIQFSPEVISGNVFREGTEMNVYVSDDKNKLPLLIESPVSVGSIKAVLKSYKGLRHEMTATH
jgi:hypothetical protein